MMTNTVVHFRRRWTKLNANPDRGMIRPLYLS